VYRVFETLDALRRAYPDSPEVLYVAYRIYSENAVKALSDLVRTAPTPISSSERR